MLVRYRTDSGTTISDFKADLDGIIQGTITSVNQLSTTARTNSTIVGSYPTGKYTRVNQTSYTYSKAHNEVAGYTHYFRLTFDSTMLTTVTLASGYTSGTDTLLNSTATSVNIQNFRYDSAYPTAFDIIINDKFIFFCAPQSNTYLGLFDLGHTGITRAYTNSMLMGVVNLNNTLNNNVASPLPLYWTTTGVTVPYSYNMDTLSYGTLSSGFSANTPFKRINSSGAVTITENPVYTVCFTTSNDSKLIYGMYKTPTNAFSGIQTYKDSSNLYRLNLYDFSLLVD